jgi:predicted ArsR family transcriptional regulator
MASKYVDADPRMLRAVAHPVRRTLLYELYARGAANATTLAGATDEPVNSVSFHLHQLAKYGLIEEAPDLATDGRQRWWRPAATHGLHFTGEEIEKAPGGKAAMEVFRRNSVAHWHALVERFFAPHPESEEIWTSNDVPMMLTDQEAGEYAEELYTLMTKWREHGQSTEAPAGQERHTYLGLALVLPHQTDLIEQ